MDGNCQNAMVTAAEDVVDYSFIDKELPWEALQAAGSNIADYGPESRSVVAQFEADKLLFKRWAQSVGIEEGNPKNNHHSALDNPATALAVVKILSSIQETFNKTESALLNMQHVSTADPSSKGFIDYTQGLSQKSKVSTSKRHKIGWALMGKAKFI
ncbi:hypothetical protein VE00_10435 [Pseudogymnoascus sp. WSF 3629]|nr:hypothetical protein VE00_10435 [Pseudogymnoascus sp. WSF 3629]